MALFLGTFQDIVFSSSLLFIIIGVAVGIIIGAIPGLSATMAVAVLVPVTFGFSPYDGLSLLIGVYIGGISGGLIGATLLGIPGTSSSIATTFDAYPMAKKGEPVRALGIGILGSLLGGILSFFVLVIFTSVIASYAVKLGPGDYFSLMFIAIVLISVLSRGNMIKGLISGILGIVFALVGYAPIDGTTRFTFGLEFLNNGFSLIVVMLGFFSITLILEGIINDEETQQKIGKLKGFGINLREVFSNTWNIIRSSAIGTFVGILPGLGSGGANLIAYAQTKQSSKNPDSFGKGNPAGIYASESSNNASLGGALIPLLSLGIPGDTVTAVLIGGFMVHGIRPGPMLLSSNVDIVYVIYITFLLATIFTFLMQLFGMRIFPKILQIPKSYLYTIILVLTVVGTYADNFRMTDIWLMLVLGFFGLILSKNNYPFAPLILGLVLGPLLEENLRQGIMRAGSALSMFSQPLPLIVTLLSVYILFFNIYKEIKGSKNI